MTSSHLPPPDIGSYWPPAAGPDELVLLLDGTGTVLGVRLDDGAEECRSWTGRHQRAVLPPELADVVEHALAQCVETSRTVVPSVLTAAPAVRSVGPLGPSTFVATLQIRDAEAGLARALDSEKALQDLLMTISCRFLNVRIEHVDSAIEEALGELARFVEADRAYVFEYDWTGGTTSNTHEWCAPGIAPQRQELQQIPLDFFTQWTSTHRAGRTMHVPDVRALPEGDAMRELLESQAIQSLIAIPLLDGSHCEGFVGFDSVRRRHVYSEREQLLLTFFSEICRSLRHRSHLEAMLVLERERAQAASRAKSEFLANMSHELRTPLNAIVGFTEVLGNSTLDSAQREYLGFLRQGSDALLSLISDILDFSKIEAGRLHMESVRFDVLELLETSLDLVRYQAARKGLRLLLDLPADAPRWAQGDPLRLRQILLNLLSNAVKFTAEGEVTLAVTAEAGADGRRPVTFSVRDTGIGLSEEQQQRLFTAFTQADTSTTRKYGGTGLGLAVSAGLAARMEGTLTCESALGKGARFDLRVALACEPIAQVDLVAPLARRLALIVDDHPPTRRSLRQLLEGWGFTCDETDEPLELTRFSGMATGDDVVVVDEQYVSPGAATTLRQAFGASDPPPRIVVLRAIESRLGDHPAALNGLIAGSLMKPVKPSELLSVLRPARQPDSEQGPAGRVPAFQSVSRGPVLVVDDVRTNIMVIRSMLEQLVPDLHVVEACDGVEAIQAFQREHPALVFMDLQMPVMDGKDAARAIRGLEQVRGCHTPIYALTAAAVEGQADQCIEAGMDGFLTKPANLAMIGEVLRRHLDLAALA